MFDVFVVPDDAADSLEQLGSKPKIWFRHETLGKCLFKVGRPNMGDDWSEKVACELCRLLRIPHATYELAIWKGARGVISPSFVPAGGWLLHGNELLAKLQAGYPATKSYHVRQHTLRAVLAVMRQDRIVNCPLGWELPPGISRAMDVFIGYLMLDAWIANQDRHHENWSLLVAPDRRVHLAPTYDHASSLGSNESDENRKDRLTTRNARRSIVHYVERATSAFYRLSSDIRPMPTIEAFREAARIRPEATAIWLRQLEQVSADDVRAILNQVPAERITPIGIEFAQRMLEVNRERLLALRGALR
jgi:hypothetical protein